MASHTGQFILSIENDYWYGRFPWMNNPLAHVSNPEGYMPTDSKFGALTDTQPVEQQKRTRSGVRMLGFGDEFYNRILVEPSVIDAGSVVTERFYEITVFNGYLESKQLEGINIVNQQGISLTGPVVSTVWGELETKVYQLTILAEGPSTLNSNINFNWQGISDDTNIAIAGVRISMLPFQAEVPWVETLEWQTDVLTSNNGKEQRIKLRKSPRQRFKAQYPVQPEFLARSVNIINGWLGKKWAIAVWSETQMIPHVDAGSTVIQCNTKNFDFREGGSICIWENSNNNEVIEIDSISDTFISLKQQVIGTYGQCILMPVRLGTSLGGVVSRNTNGYTSGFSLEYLVSDNRPTLPIVPPQYKGEDIYYDVNLVGESDSLSEQFTTRIDEVDYKTGVAEYFAPWLNIRRSRSLFYMNVGPTECKAFKQWLARREGRLRPFWSPTFENNIRLSPVQKGEISTALIFEDNDYKNLGFKHNHIAILDKNGIWYACEVTGVSTYSDTLSQISILPPLTIDVSLIVQVSFLTLNRLDTDSIEINWIGNGINQSTINVLELTP